MDLVEEVRSAWGWCGIDPVAILQQNAFGNLLIEDAAGAVWRLCPEDVYCKQILGAVEELQLLWADEDFVIDWRMDNLVSLAEAKLGKPGAGRCYCLKIPGVLGGEYAADNLGTMPVDQLVRFAGDVGQQIEDLPDGSKVTFRITD